jgi:hypothetical protein
MTVVLRHGGSAVGWLSRSLLPTDEPHSTADQARRADRNVSRCSRRRWVVTRQDSCPARAGAHAELSRAG